MKGFGPEFESLPDYILKVTKTIWEDREVDALERFYAEDIVMRSTSELQRGRGTVVADTLSMLGAFPDKEILGEDVIWCEDGEGSYLSSHRAMTLCTHAGHAAFGPPTGRAFRFRAVADCAVKDEVIYDEWLARDNSAIAIQLGREPEAEARAQIALDGGPERAVRPLRAEDDVVHRYTGRGNDDEWGERLADTLTRVMAANVAAIRHRYDRAAAIFHPGCRDGFSWRFAETEWTRLRSALPSAEFRVDHAIGRSDPGEPHRAAVRWSLTGSHDGHGAFGAPTHAPVHVMGFTHAEFGPHGTEGWGIRREYTVFDEIAVWKQIALHTGRL